MWISLSQKFSNRRFIQNQKIVQLTLNIYSKFFCTVFTHVHSIIVLAWLVTSSTNVYGRTRRSFLFFDIQTLRSSVLYSHSFHWGLVHFWDLNSIKTASRERVGTYWLISAISSLCNWVILSKKQNLWKTALIASNSALFSWSSNSGSRCLFNASSNCVSQKVTRRILFMWTRTSLIKYMFVCYLIVLPKQRKHTLPLWTKIGDDFKSKKLCSCQTQAPNRGTFQTTNEQFSGDENGFRTMENETDWKIQWLQKLKEDIVVAWYGFTSKLCHNFFIDLHRKVQSNMDLNNVNICQSLLMNYLRTIMNFDPILSFHSVIDQKFFFHAQFTQCQFSVLIKKIPVLLLDF